MQRLLKGSLLLLAIILLIALGGVLTFFLLRNAQWVVIRVPMLEPSWSDPLAVAEYETPLALVMVGACAVGALLALLALVPATLRRAVERRRERRFLGDLEQELSELRNLPVTSPAPLEDEALDLERQEGWDASDRADEDALMEALQDSAGKEGKA